MFLINADENKSRRKKERVIRKLPKRLQGEEEKEK